MNVLCLGISHRTASVQMREQLSLSGESLCRALDSFTIQPEAFAPLSEVAVLSTCSRLEIYAVHPDAPPLSQGTPEDLAPLLRYAGEILGGSKDELLPALYFYSGEAAVRHLCRVAASLDSMVLGEPQILGQVSAAHRMSIAQGSARHVLSSLFRTAVHAGKRVRTDTAIGRSHVSMSAIAIRLAEAELGSLREHNALVIGTGEIGKQSIKALREHGVRSLAVASRSAERAAVMAEEWSARPVTQDRLIEVLDQVDVVLSSSNQTGLILERSALEGVLAQRGERKLVLVDLAVPRNIDPAIRSVTGGAVKLFDIDDIQAFTSASISSRQKEIPHAEAMIDEETAAFMRWLAVIPVVGELHRRAETIRQQEVERTLRFLQDPDPRVVEHIERLSQSLVRKLLHEPTARLRHEADGENLENFVDAVTSLFGLPDVEFQPQAKGENP